MSVVKKKVEVPEFIDPHKMVDVKLMGNITEISISDRQNSGATIIPISKEEYVIASTGEIKDFKNHATDRTGNLRNLEKTMRNLSDLINANVTPENAMRCRFLTLTYQENVREPERLYHDFKNFNKRLKRLLEKQGYHYEYIYTVECQQRGSFHIHAILIFDRTAPFIENSVLNDLWGHGFVSVKAVSPNTDNIGAYLVSYLTDLPTEKDAEIPPEIAGGRIKEVTTDGKSKRIIKKARLKLIPAGTKIYRYSRGIRKPTTVKLPYGDVIDQLESAGYRKTQEFAIEVSDIDRDFRNKFVKQIYKKHVNQTWKTNDTKGD